MLWLHATTIGAAGQDPPFLLKTYRRSEHYENEGERMNYCIYANVMGCQNSCQCCLLLNVATHCYALHDKHMSLASFVRIYKRIS